MVTVICKGSILQLKKEAIKFANIYRRIGDAPAALSESFPQPQSVSGIPSSGLVSVRLMGCTNSGTNE